MDDKSKLPTWLRDTTLALAIVSGIFVYMWVTYCHVYFRALSFPFYFWNMPQAFLLTRLVTIFVQFNLLILSLVLLIYWLIIWIFPPKRYISIGLILLILLPTIVFVLFSSLNDNLPDRFIIFYQFLRNEVGLFLITYTPNIWVYGSAIVIILCILYHLIPKSDSYKKFKDAYLSTNRDKYSYYILIILFITAVNYLFIVLMASEQSEGLIRGVDGYDVLRLDIEKNTNNSTNKLPDNLSLILIYENNYYLFKKNPKFNVTSDNPVPIYIVPVAKIQNAMLKRINGSLSIKYKVISNSTQKNNGSINSPELLWWTADHQNPSWYPDEGPKPWWLILFPLFALLIIIRLSIPIIALAFHAIILAPILLALLGDWKYKRLENGCSRVFDNLRWSIELGCLGRGMSFKRLMIIILLLLIGGICYWFLAITNNAYIYY